MLDWIPASAAMGGNEALGWTVVVVVGVMAVHIWAPLVHEQVHEHGERLNSLGRGLAVTYVFVRLFREVSEGDQLLGPRIYLIVLFGFLVYYGVEHKAESRLLKQSADPADPMVRLHFGMVILLKWIYSWLLIYALPDSIRSEGAQVIPAVIAIALHILHDDVELAVRFRDHYNHEGRYVLASAAVVAWGCDLISIDDNPYVSHALTAVLTGSVLYTTFSGELQDHRKSQFPWFLVGVGLFLLLDLMSGSRLWSN